MTDPSVINLDPNLMGLGWGNLNVLDRELFARFPCYRSLHGNISRFVDVCALKRLRRLLALQVIVWRFSQLAMTSPRRDGPRTFPTVSPEDIITDMYSSLLK